MYTSNSETRQSKRFFLGLISGIVFLELLIRILSPVIGPPLQSWNTMEDAKKFKLEQLGAKPNGGVFILGNSTALLGVNSSELSRNLTKNTFVFNAAMNGSDSSTMTELAIDYLIPRYRPRLVIFFFSPGTLLSSRSTLRSGSSLTSSMMPTNIKVQLSQYLRIFEYRNNLRDPMIMNVFRKSLLTRSSGHGIVNSWADDLDSFGFSVFPISSNSISGGWSLNAIQPFELSNEQLPSAAVEDLKAVSSLAQEFGTRLVISTVPLPRLDQEYRSQVEQMARHLNLDFIQGNDAVQKGKYFSDAIHLNSAGSQAFTKFILRKLKDYGIN